MSATSTALAVGCLALVYSAREARLLHVPVPQLKRQVRQRRSLGQSRPNVLGLGYGIGLGGGVFTHVTTATFVVVAAAAVASGDVAAGAILVGAFGLARALPLLLVPPEAARSETTLRKTTDSIFVWDPLVHMLNALALAFVGATFLVSSVNM